MKTRTRLAAAVAASAILLGAGGIVTAATADSSPVPTVKAPVATVSSGDEAVCFMWPNMNFYVCI